LIREGKEPINAFLPEIRHKVFRRIAGKDKCAGIGIARLDMENAFPDVRGCETGVREDHQIKVFARRASTDRDRFAAAGLYNGHKAAMGLKDRPKTSAK